VIRVKGTSSDQLRVPRLATDRWIGSDRLPDMSIPTLPDMCIPTHIHKTPQVLSPHTRRWRNDAHYRRYACMISVAAYSWYAL